MIQRMFSMILLFAATPASARNYVFSPGHRHGSLWPIVSLFAAPLILAAVVAALFSVSAAVRAVSREFLRSAKWFFIDLYHVIRKFIGHE